jgi:hypothetical protein
MALPAYWAKEAATPSSCSWMRNRFKSIIQNRIATARKSGLTREDRLVLKKFKEVG